MKNIITTEYSILLFLVFSLLLMIFFFFLDPKTDQYIARCLRELISIYLPKILIGVKPSDELPLIKFFEEKQDNEIPERALLLELIVSTFFNKRNRTPDSSVAQVNILLVTTDLNI